MTRRKYSINLAEIREFDKEPAHFYWHVLERVNYLISTEVQLPVEEMADRIADIMFAAFGLTPA